MGFNLSSLLAPAEKYLGTTTAKVLPLVTGTVGTILAADPNQISAALTPFLPLFGPGVTSAVGAGITALSVVHGLLTKSPATPAIQQPQSPPAAIANELVSEASLAPAAQSMATGVPAAVLQKLLQAAQTSPTKAPVPASAGTTSSPILTHKEPGPMTANQSNMPVMSTGVTTVSAPNNWLNEVEVISTDIQNSMPVINEVLAMVQGLTGKTIPGVATGEAVAAVILTDVQGFAAGKLISAPTTTISVGGVKIALSLSAQKVG